MYYYYNSSRLGIVFVHSSGMTCTRGSHNLTAHKIVALFLSNLLIKSSRVGAGHFTKEKTCKKLLYVIIDRYKLVLLDILFTVFSARVSETP